MTELEKLQDVVKIAAEFSLPNNVDKIHLNTFAYGLYILGVRKAGQAVYRIDGHHLHFECCENVLSIVYNESDNIENLKACPFCGAEVELVSNYE